jgi:hypothetical protein
MSLRTSSIFKRPSVRIVVDYQPAIHPWIVMVDLRLGNFLAWQCDLLRDALGRRSTSLLPDCRKAGV